METINKELSLEERQANIHRFIKRWKEERVKVHEEFENRVKTPEYQAMLRELRKKKDRKSVV